MFKKSLSLFCNLICLWVIVSAYSSELVDTEEKKDGFYEDRQHGYYWYEDEKPIEPQKIKETPLPKYSYRELWDMHPDEFQKHFNEVTKKAVQFPTEENAVEFLKLKNIATQKSMAFASVMTLVAQQHPEYASDTSSPVAAPGQRAQTRMKDNEIKRTIFTEKENFALVMFVRKGCGFCEEQGGILEYFENLYNWQVRQVDIEDNPVMAQKFNIQITPTLLIVNKSGDHMMISSGVVTMNDIEKRIYRSIRLMNGDIDEKQWLMYDYQQKMGDDPLKNIRGEQHVQ